MQIVKFANHLTISYLFMPITFCNVCNSRLSIRMSITSRCRIKCTPSALIAKTPLPLFSSVDGLLALEYSLGWHLKALLDRKVATSTTTYEHADIDKGERVSCLSLSADGTSHIEVRWFVLFNLPADTCVVTIVESWSFRQSTLNPPPHEIWSKILFH